MDISYNEDSEESYDEYIARLKREISTIENRGFIFLVDCHDLHYVPDRVALPDGRVLDQSELSALLKNHPLDFNLTLADKLMDLYFAEGLEDFRHSSNSFLSGEDERAALDKYSKSQKV
ncbi:MAG: hypothetical protein ABIE22_01860 [archaeon]